MNGRPDGDECSRGYWCAEPLIHHPDLPHSHYRSLWPSTTIVTDTGSTLTG